MRVSIYLIVISLYIAFVRSWYKASTYKEWKFRAYCDFHFSSQHVAHQLSLWRGKEDRNRIKCVEPILVDRGINLKLGQFLKRKKLLESSNKAQQACKRGLVLVNGKKQYSTFQLKDGDSVFVNLTTTAEATNSAEDAIHKEKLISRLAKFTNSLIRADRNPPLHTIYEDDYMAVVFKPAGVHSLTWVNTMKNRQFALDDVLVCLLSVPEESDALSRPIPCHRLDSRVCGCLVVAKTSAALEHINNQFAFREVKKVYTALLVGDINLSQEIICQYGTIGKEFLISFPIGGKQSQSVIEVLESTRCNVNGAMHRVRLTLLTGRRHQLRIHCALLGCPILGDDLYHGIGKLPSLSARMKAVTALSQKSIDEGSLDDDEGESSLDVMKPFSSTEVVLVEDTNQEEDRLNAVRRGQGLFLMSTAVSLRHPNASFVRSIFDSKSTSTTQVLPNGMKERISIDLDSGEVSVSIDEVPRFLKMFEKARKGAEWARLHSID
eukprot:gene34378-41611_t